MYTIKYYGRQSGSSEVWTVVDIAITGHQHDQGPSSPRHQHSAALPLALEVAADCRVHLLPCWHFDVDNLSRSDTDSIMSMARSAVSQ